MTTLKKSLHRLQSANLSRGEAWKHVVIWILLTLAVVLLVVFTAVVDDITQRGELRRSNQKVSGSLKVPKDLPSGGIDVMDLWALTRYKLGGH